MSLKSRARYAVSRAVASGHLKRLPCEVCGTMKTDGHHEDYARPLDVLWLCRRHHQERHFGRISASHDVQLAFRVKPEIKNFIRQIAHEERRSINNVVIDLLTSQLAKHHFHIKSA